MSRRTKLNAYTTSLVQGASEALGVGYMNVMSAERTRPLPLVRSLICRELRASGLSLHQCGTALNRDHSSVCHYAGTIGQSLLYPCPDERELLLNWKTFIVAHRLAHFCDYGT